MCDLFCQFLLPLRLSARKSENKKNSDDIHWNVWTNIKTLYAQKKYFQERIPHLRFLNHLYFGSNVVFWGTALGRFLSSANHCGRHFCSAPPTIKKLLILYEYNITLHNILAYIEIYILTFYHTKFFTYVKNFCAICVCFPDIY